MWVMRVLRAGAGVGCGYGVRLNVDSLTSEKVLTAPRVVPIFLCNILPWQFA